MTQPHEFDLIVTGLDVNDDAAVDRLYEAGFDDAMVARVGGETRLAFTRESTDREQTIRGAAERLLALGIRTVAVEMPDGVRRTVSADAGGVIIADPSR